MSVHYEIYDATKNGDLTTFKRLVSDASVDDLEWCMEVCTSIDIFKLLYHTYNIRNFIDACYKIAGPELQEYIENNVPQSEIGDHHEFSIDLSDSDDDEIFDAVCDNDIDTFNRLVFNTPEESLELCMGVCKNIDIFKVLYHTYNVTGDSIGMCYEIAGPELQEYIKNNVPNFKESLSIKNNK